MDLKSTEARFAIDAVQRAAGISCLVAGEMAHQARDKADCSPVTVADFAIQAVFSKWLKEKFPADALVAEETSETLRQNSHNSVLQATTSFVVRALTAPHSPDEVLSLIDWGRGKPEGRFWTLDPVDGTKGFLRGEHYAVALALLEKGQPVLSVLGCPRLGMDGSFQKNGPGTLTVAVRGGGAWIRPMDPNKNQFTRLRVSRRSNLAEMIVLRSVEASHANADHLAPVLARHGIRTPPILMDSQAKYTMLSLGKADLFFYLVSRRNPDHRMKIWDVAPGALVVEEAGGKITDMQGHPLNFTRGETIADNPGLVITNGRYHDAALKILQEAEKERI